MVWNGMSNKTASNGTAPVSTPTGRIPRQELESREWWVLGLRSVSPSIKEADESARPGPTPAV